MAKIESHHFRFEIVLSFHRNLLEQNQFAGTRGPVDFTVMPREGEALGMSEASRLNSDVSGILDRPVPPVPRLRRGLELASTPKL
jgi:hypothetical protein